MAGAASSRCAASRRKRRRKPVGKRGDKLGENPCEMLKDILSKGFSPTRWPGGGRLSRAFSTRWPGGGAGFAGVFLAAGVTSPATAVAAAMTAAAHTLTTRPTSRYGSSARGSRGRQSTRSRQPEQDKIGSGSPQSSLELASFRGRWRVCRRASRRGCQGPMMLAAVRLGAGGLRGLRLGRCWVSGSARILGPAFGRPQDPSADASRDRSNSAPSRNMA